MASASAMVLQGGEVDHAQQTMQERSREARRSYAAAELLMEGEICVDDDGFMAPDPISPSTYGDSTSSYAFSSDSCTDAPSMASTSSSSASANFSDPDAARDHHHHHLHDSGASPAEEQFDTRVMVKKSTAFSGASGRMDLCRDVEHRQESSASTRAQRSSRFRDLRLTDLVPLLPRPQPPVHHHHKKNLQLPSTNNDSRSHCCCPTNSQHPRCEFSRRGPGLNEHQTSDRGLPPDSSQLSSVFCSKTSDLPAAYISAEDRLHAAMLATSNSPSFVNLGNGSGLRRRSPLYKSGVDDLHVLKADAAAVPSPECRGSSNVTTEKQQQQTRQPRRAEAATEVRAASGGRNHSNSTVDMFRIESLQQKSILQRDSSMDAFRIDSLQMKRGKNCSSSRAFETTELSFQLPPAPRSVGLGVRPTGEGQNRCRIIPQLQHKKQKESSSLLCSQGSSGIKQHMLEKLLSSAMIRALGSTDIITSPLPRMPLIRTDDNPGCCSSANSNNHSHNDNAVDPAVSASSVHRHHRRRHRLASTSTASAAADNFRSGSHLTIMPSLLLPKRREEEACSCVAAPVDFLLPHNPLLSASLLAVSARCLPAYASAPTACRINPFHHPSSRSAPACDAPPPPSGPSLHFAPCRSPRPPSQQRLHQQAYLECTLKDGVRCYTMRMKGSQEPILLARACGALAAAQTDDLDHHHHHHQGIHAAASWPGRNWLYSFHDHSRKGKSKRGAGRWRSWIGKGNSNGKASSSDLVGMMSVSRFRSPVDGPNSRSTSCGGTKISTDIEKRKKMKIVSEFVLYDAANGDEKRCGDEKSGGKQNSKRTVAQPPCSSSSSNRCDADSRNGPKTHEESADRDDVAVVSSQQQAAAAAQNRNRRLLAPEKNCSSSHIHKLLPGRKSSDSVHHGHMDAPTTDVLLQQQFSSPQFLGIGSYSASNRSSWSLDFWSDSEDSAAAEVPLLLVGFPYKELAAVVIQEPASAVDDAEEEEEEEEEEFWERSTRKEDDMNAGGNEEEGVGGVCGWGLKFLAMDCAAENEKDGGKGLKATTTTNRVRNRFMSNSSSASSCVVAGRAAVMATDIGKQESEYTTTTLLLPAGEHGMPSLEVEDEDGGRGRPSTLIERWRSGGRCDCGGWDEGCGLRVWSTDEKENEDDEAKLRHGRRSSKMWWYYKRSCSIYAAEQGWGRKEEMVKLQQCVLREQEDEEEEEGGGGSGGEDDGGGGEVVVRLSFQSQNITPLAAFATAVAILDKDPTKWTTTTTTTTTTETAPPRQAVSLPPTMGKAAAFGGGNVEGKVDHFTRAVVPRTTESSSRRQAAAAAAAGCGRII